MGHMDVPVGYFRAGRKNLRNVQENKHLRVLVKKLNKSDGVMCEIPVEAQLTKMKIQLVSVRKRNPKYRRVSEQSPVKKNENPAGKQMPAQLTFLVTRCAYSLLMCVEMYVGCLCKTRAAA